MIKVLLKIFFIVLIALLQFVLMPILNIKGAIPNLILIGSLVLILSDFETDAFYLAGLGGIILDLGSPTFFGFNTFLLILLVFLARFLSKKYLPETNYLNIFLIVFLGSLIFGFVSTLILKEQITIVLLIGGIYAAILGLFFFRILLTLNKPNQMILNQ